MTATSERGPDLAHLECTLRTKHRHGVRTLTLTAHEDGVEVGGQAVSYYAVQLVIRDVLAAGYRIRRTRVRVRRS